MHREAYKAQERNKTNTFTWSKHRLLRETAGPSLSTELQFFSTWSPHCKPRAPCPQVSGHDTQVDKRNSQVWMPALMMGLYMQKADRREVPCVNTTHGSSLFFLFHLTCLHLLCARERAGGYGLRLTHLGLYAVSSKIKESPHRTRTPLS